MEAVPEQVVVVEEVKSSEGNPFILFILFVLILAIHYIIPLIGTLYAQKSARKWIAYWVTLLLINSVLHPLLAFCLGASGATFLNLVLGALVLYVVSDEKVIDFGCRLICSLKPVTSASKLPPSSTTTSRREDCPSCASTDL
jgi:hypothetical protein